MGFKDHFLKAQAKKKKLKKGTLFYQKLSCDLVTSLPAIVAFARGWQFLT